MYQDKQNRGILCSGPNIWNEISKLKTQTLQAWTREGPSISFFFRYVIDHTRSLGNLGTILCPNSTWRADNPPFVFVSRHRTTHFSLDFGEIDPSSKVKSTVWAWEIGSPQGRFWDPTTRETNTVLNSRRCGGEAFSSLASRGWRCGSGGSFLEPSMSCRWVKPAAGGRIHWDFFGGWRCANMI